MKSIVLENILRLVSFWAGMARLSSSGPAENCAENLEQYPNSNVKQDMFDMLKELGLFTLPFPEERGF
jgi:hypothetical protein